MVAEAAGVSRSTVSRVVNGSPKVRPDVAEAVAQTIARLNYVPNQAARSLASSRTQAIALIVPEDTARFFGDPYFASIVSGISAGLEDSDYILNLLVASPDPGHKARRFLSGGNVDGALIISHHVGDRQLLPASGGLPLVFGGRPVMSGMAQAPYVDVDNFAGGYAATQHLLKRGCRKVATITGPSNMPASVDRLAGWQAAVSALALDTTAVADGDFTAVGAARAMSRLLESHPDLDGIFVASDLMAQGALGVLAERGLSVPRDVAVIGFDDSPVALATRPQLTTIRQPSRLMGTMMSEILIGLLEGREPEQRATIVNTELIIRDSA